MHTLKVIAVVALIATLSSACSSLGSRAGSINTARGLSEDQRHRLYAAALAVSDSPMDTDAFKEVCQRIGIFDAAGKPNDQYMVFVSQHVNWGMQSEASEFRQEINSKERARGYIEQHLSDR
jgi:hypothetical protein